MKLLTVTGEALEAAPPSRDRFVVPGRVGRDLFTLLSERNGFYAFESALHVLPSSAPVGLPSQSLESWNAPDGWRRAFGSMDPGLVFFAEDLFGLQFGTEGESVFSFNPESAQTVKMSESLTEWGDKVVSGYSYMTGYPLAHEWQVCNGRLPVGHRLIPKIPFVAGGPFDVQNLVLVESGAAMRYWGEFACAVAHVRDGEQFKLDVSKVERIRCARDVPGGTRQCGCSGC